MVLISLLMLRQIYESPWFVILEVSKVLSRFVFVTWIFNRTKSISRSVVQNTEQTSCLKHGYSTFYFQLADVIHSLLESSQLKGNLTFSIIAFCNFYDCKVFFYYFLIEFYVAKSFYFRNMFPYKNSIVINRENNFMNPKIYK